MPMFSNHWLLIGSVSDLWRAAQHPKQSGLFDLQRPADSVGDGNQVTGIRAHHQIVASQRTLNDAGVNHIAGCCPGCQRTGSSCAVVVEHFDGASDEEARKESLAASSPPCLGDDGSGHRRDLADLEESLVTSPHSPSTSVSGDEGASVVRDAHQALRRWGDPL